MPKSKQRANPARARLDVIAAADDDVAFLRVVREMLDSKQRLEREAAIEALAKRPLPAAREIMRDVYLQLNEDGNKHDQGCGMRSNIVRAHRDRGLEGRRHRSARV